MRQLLSTSAVSSLPHLQIAVQSLKHESRLRVPLDRRGTLFAEE
jgi:hypothetical protein